MAVPAEGNFYTLIGQTLRQAQQQVAPAFVVRAIVVDGVPQLVDTSMVGNRVNVEITNGRISKIRNMG